MKIKFIIFLVIFSLLSFSEQPKWDVGYIYFDKSDPETYLSNIDGPIADEVLVIINGNRYSRLNKYRKYLVKDLLVFRIYDEIFTSDKNQKHTIDTLSTSLLDDIPFLSDEFIKENSWNLGKGNLFKKLYIIEKYSQDKIIRTQVRWVYAIE
jgi:hypothetical protein